MKPTKIELNSAEIQSGHNRVNSAEGLILQLPKNHDGRNSWLLNYGIREEAIKLREVWTKTHNENLIWSKETESLQTALF